MTRSFRQRLLIAVGIFAALLSSFNLFAQGSLPAVNPQFIIHCQEEYAFAIESIEELAAKLYCAHQKYPKLAYMQVYNNEGSIMGFTITGVPQSIEADNISSFLYQLELLGNAVNTMDLAFLPESKNEKLSGRVSKKQATETHVASKERVVIHRSLGNNFDLIATNQ